MRRQAARAQLTWAAVHGVPLHALSEGEGGHVGVGVHALAHVTARHALGAAAGALAAGGAKGARCAALFGAVIGCGGEGAGLERQIRLDKHSCASIF